MKVQRRRKRKSIFKRIKKWIGKIGTLNIVLICIGLFFIWFNYQMLELFKLCGAIPETYACAVIAATIGECGFCGWIKTTKIKRMQREWDKEDQKERELNNNKEGGEG